MNQKIMILALGLTLAIAATLAVTPIVDEMAYEAHGGHANDGNPQFHNALLVNVATCVVSTC